MGVRCAALLATTMLLSGCSFLTFGLLGDDDQVKHRGPSMGKVVAKLPELNLPPVEDFKPTRAEVMAAYNQVYGMLPDATENHAVGRRLADLHMAQGEDLDIEGAETPYLPAIGLYEKLLDEDANADQRDAILYQLARAHDLSADSERKLHYLNRLINDHPDSEYLAEAKFRRGEIYFSAEQYRDAAADYEYVVRQGVATPYYLNASYMLGWSEFKRMRFEDGLPHFFDVVDDILSDHQAAELEQVDDQLLNDSFRVITLALAYLDGAQSLADMMRIRGKPHWQYLAYQQLAQDYFDKERYLDSVATWQAFIEHNSLDARAPAAHQGMIKTLMDAGFPSEVIPKKKAFVQRYGVYSDFWQHHGEDTRAGYIDTLHEYLSELSKLAHADAQAYDAKFADNKKVKGEKFDPVERRSLYLQAANWYEEMIATFPGDPRTADFLFLLGETYTEASEHGRAVAAYQQVIREYPQYHQAHEAGYAAILGLGELVASASVEELELWQRLKVDAQIEFALVFPGDPRAPAVQADAADTLFGMGFADEAIDLAENLLLEWPDVAVELRRTALLIIGHGRFERDEFAAAETAYHELLTMDLEPDAAQRVNERLLAAVYKQGEAAEAAGEVDVAVQHFLRVAQLDATSPLAAQGHFDAVAVLESAQRIPQAAALLSEFRSLYAGHALTAGIDLRLAGMYELTGDLAAAAAEYTTLSRTAEDAETRRGAKYRTAEIYLELDDVPAAIEHFRDYAHTYKQPADIRLEAMHHMDELYQRTGEEDKRRFWLRKKIELHRDLGGDATERSTYLAASAQFIFAADEKVRFQSLRLTHPLKRSLKKKQKALKKTLKAYELAAGYKVAEFATASTFEIADLYRQLSKSIMDSDRPKNLNELEMAQYDILLEEQAYPFEEQAISLHEINQQKAWDGIYDDWVQKSFAELAELMPGRFNKPEQEVVYADAIH